MSKDLLEMAKELVMSLIQAGLLRPEDMQQELQNTHASLLKLKAREAGEESGGAHIVNGTAENLPFGQICSWTTASKQTVIRSL